MKKIYLIIIFLKNILFVFIHYKSWYFINLLFLKRINPFHYNSNLLYKNDWSKVLIIKNDNKINDNKINNTPKNNKVAIIIENNNL